MERERVRWSALTLSVSQLMDLTEQRNIYLYTSSFLSYCKPRYTQYMLPIRGRGVGGQGGDEWPTARVGSGV